jgi:hypothetical protein
MSVFTHGLDELPNEDDITNPSRFSKHLKVVDLLCGSLQSWNRSGRAGPDRLEGLNRPVFAGFYRFETFFEPAGPDRSDNSGPVPTLSSLSNNTMRRFSLRLE